MALRTFKQEIAGLCFRINIMDQFNARGIKVNEMIELTK